MTLKTFLRAGSLTALGAALALGAVPAAAQPENDTDVQHNAERPARPAQARQQVRQEARQEIRQQRQEARAERQWQPPQRSQAAAAQERGGREWNRGDRRSDTATQRSGREWNRRDNASNDWGQARAARAQAQQQAQAQAAADRARSERWSGTRQGGTASSNDWQRNRTYGDRSRNQTYRDGYRDGARNDSWRDRQQQQNAYRSGYRDGTRTDSYRDGQRRYSGDYRRWSSNDWRRDNRYNWYSYRNSNRNLYRIGRYYSPYGNYRYSRLSIGFRLGSLFYGSRYWINDPWQYRLPEAYGPYRWVRYYDDALLVDIYTGEVVDVVYDFFW